MSQPPAIINHRFPSPLQPLSSPPAQHRFQRRLLHLVGDFSWCEATKRTPKPNPYPFHLTVDRLRDPNGGASDLPATVEVADLTVLLNYEGG